MKSWQKKVAREGARAWGRSVVVTLHPPIGGKVAEVEVREKGRSNGYRVSFGQLFSILATRAAGLTMQGRRTRRG